MQQQKQQQSGIKHLQTSAPVGSVAFLKNVNNGNSSILQYQQPLVHSSGLLSEYPNLYMSTPATPFGMVAPTPTIAPYIGPSAGPYDLAGVPIGSSGNPSLGGSHLNSSEPHVSSGYYNRASTYGCIGMKHHYQASYQPQ